jgi:hypothetical protein
LALLEKYGLQHYSEIGRKGGRPSYRGTIPQAESKINFKEAELAKANLADLKVLWKQIQKRDGMLSASVPKEAIDALP